MTTWIRESISKISKFIVVPYTIILIYEYLTPNPSEIPSFSFDTRRVITHFTAFLILSYLYLFSFKRSKKLILFLFFLAIILEFLQSFVPGRIFDVYDLLANILGISIGIYVRNLFSQNLINKFC